MSRGPYPTIAAAEAATDLSVDVEAIETFGYHTAGDGGGATYANPVAADPGKSDQIYITSINRWLRRVHEDGVDLQRHGCYGDAYENALRDDTSVFMDAIALAIDLHGDKPGLPKITGRNGRSYRVVDGAIPGDILMDGKGAALVAAFNEGGSGVSENVLRDIPTDRTVIGAGSDDMHGTLAGASGHTIAMHNWVLDGQYDRLISLQDNGPPLIFFFGCHVEMMNFTARRQGKAGESPAKAQFLDSRAAGVLLYDCPTVSGRAVTMEASPCEDLYVLSSDQSTHLELYSFRASKQRYYDDNLHTNTPLTVYNLSPGSVVDGCRVTETRKSSINWFSAGTLKNYNLNGASESSAVDTNEAAAACIGKCRFINGYVKRTFGPAIRLGRSGVTVDQLTVDDALEAVRIECNLDETQTLFPELPSTDDESSGILLRNIYTPQGLNQQAGENAVIRAFGASASKPVHVTLGGAIGGLHPLDYPALKTEYSFLGQHAHLTLEKGLALGHGRTGLIRFEGQGNRLDGADVTFAPETGLTVSTVIVNSGTLDGRLVDCRRITALDAGQKDFLLAGSTTANDVNLYIDNCPTMDTTDVAI